MTTILFRITNLTCEACVRLSRGVLERINGVTRVVIDLETGQSEITADRAITWAEITNALGEVGKEGAIN